jgi:hypothetical protein
LVYLNTKLHYLGAADGISAIYVDNSMNFDHIFYMLVLAYSPAINPAQALPIYWQF